jgi:multidrug resistance protein
MEPQKKEQDESSVTTRGDINESGSSQDQVVSHNDQPRSELPASSAEQPDNPPPYSIYSLWEKRWIVLGASISAFFSPLSAQIYLPALPVLADDFKVSPSKINLTVTTYMIFQGITPMFIGGFADSGGRRPAYVICFVVYIAANIGLALSPDYISVLVVRCLQSAGSSTTVALCQAVMADIITSSERGSYIGITVIPIVLAPSLGPVLGGVLSQYLGWRAIFWFLTIAATINLAVLLLFFPETCRRIVGDGSERAHPIYRTCWQMIQDWRRKRAAAKAEKNGQGEVLERTTSSMTNRRPEPFRFTPPNLLLSLTLLFQKELGLLLFYSSIVFAGFYAIATAMPSQLQENYGLNDVEVGLMYLPLAIGSIVAAFIVGPTQNRNYRRHAAKMGLPPVDRSRQDDLTNFPIERARLEVGLPLLALSAIVILSWGWAMQTRAHLAVLCLLMFLMGVGMIGFNNSSSVLIVDIYPSNAGAAVAANNLTRCLIGAAASAVIVPMINAMGVGWAFTVLGVLYIVLSPMLFLIMNKGIQWRAEIREKEERKQKKKSTGHGSP